MKHVIIGAGAAGITAAKTIRELQPDAEITVVSADLRVHSRCMLHKVLAHERSEASLNFAGEDFFAQNKITWLPGRRLAALKPACHSLSLDDGTALCYDRLLLAMGADSFIPPVGALRTAPNVFGLRNLSDVQKIDALVRQDSRVLIVGAGLVGLDAAYALCERGISVTVVELAQTVLAMQLDQTAAAAYQELFEAHGCRFILGRKASETAVGADGGVTRVVLDDGSPVDCDLVLVTTGVRSSIAALQGSGLAAGRGITVDTHLRTSTADIFAAGDVTALSGTWPNAAAQGQVAAYNMCGTEMTYDDTYCMKNTINFYGLVTMSIGKYQQEDGDEVFSRESRTRYERIVLNGGKVRSVILQGRIDYGGFWQYLIKNGIDVTPYRDKLFSASFAEEIPELVTAYLTQYVKDRAVPCR